MQLILFAFLATVHVAAKRFVLLDPDSSDLEKEASSIKDENVRSRSIKMAQFRKWLKYDVDCDFISKDDLNVKIAQGRCPYLPETEETNVTASTKKPKSFFFKRKRKPVPKTDNSLFSHENKESVVRAIVGNNKMQIINWTPLSPPEVEVVSGSMITFKCDEDGRKKERKESRKDSEEGDFIEWFVNGKRVKPSWFDWRVSVSIDGKLGIWPIGESDSGHFECLSNGQLKASVTVKVVPISKVLLNGFYNYLFVCAIFAVATIPIGCLLGNRNQEVKSVEVDRMEEFLSENVFKTDEMAKKNIAKIIGKQNLVDERQFLDNKAKSNRSTIMILLQKPKIDDKESDNKEQKLSEKPSTSTGESTDTKITVTETTKVSGNTNTNLTTTTTTKVESEIASNTTKTKEENEKKGSDDLDDVTTGKTSKNTSTTGRSKTTEKKKKKTERKTSKNERKVEKKAKITGNTVVAKNTAKKHPSNSKNPAKPKNKK